MWGHSVVSALTVMTIIILLRAVHKYLYPLTPGADLRRFKNGGGENVIYLRGLQ